MREKLTRLLDIHYGIEHIPVNEEWIRSFWSWKCGLSTFEKYACSVKFRCDIGVEFTWKMFVCWSVQCERLYR